LDYFENKIPSIQAVILAMSNKLATKIMILPSSLSENNIENIAT
jgi:hypothetical protein